MNATYYTAGSIAFGLALLLGLRTAAIAGEADTREKHWAYQPIQRPAVPGVSGLDWGRNPIDRFIRARLEAEGIKPVPAADRRTLIRRAYLDLIGLPPSPEDAQAFLEDASPDAFARVVDRLLASPRYGERWARHWLDVARFAETNGYERDGTKPNAWRYRDYVIDSLNHDKSYDRFLTEQLAGDEIEGSGASAQIATTFLRLGTWDDEPAEPKVDRYDQLDDVLGTAATAFLGITLRCARCHDHKFEPFSQVDYYRMLAVFEPLKRPQLDRADLDRPVGTERELVAYHTRAARADAEFAETWGRIEGLVKIEIERLVAPAGGPKGGKQPAKRTSLPPLVVAAFRAESSKRTLAQRELVKEFADKLAAEVREIAPAEVREALRPLELKLAAIKAARGELPRAYIWYEDGPKAPVTHVLKRGNPDQKGIAVEAGLPAVLAAKQSRKSQADAEIVRSAALAGAVADEPGEPAGGASACQPGLAVPFRTRTGQHQTNSARRGDQLFVRNGTARPGSRALAPPGGSPGSSPPHSQQGADRTFSASAWDFRLVLPPARPTVLRRQCLSGPGFRACARE